ncbi:MAG: hypothetical protein P8Y44_05465 [Acidobacteriota bacterium]
MKKSNFSETIAAPAAWILLLAATLIASACDNSVNFTPTAPVWTDVDSGVRALVISGELKADDGACLEATVLYDGEELVGARSICSKSAGCKRLQLEAQTYSASGHHTISFKVLRQSRKAVNYEASTSILVTRENIALGGATLQPQPTQARLRAGESVSFDIDFSD